MRKHSPLIFRESERHSQDGYGRTSNIQHRTSNTEHPTPNIQHPTSNIQHPTSNIEHPTPNIQHPTSNIQRPTSNIQHLTSNVQHPTSNTQQLTTDHSPPTLRLCWRDKAVVAGADRGTPVRHLDRAGDGLSSDVLEPSPWMGEVEGVPILHGVRGAGLSHETERHGVTDTHGRFQSQRVLAALHGPGPRHRHERVRAQFGVVLVNARVTFPDDLHNMGTVREISDGDGSGDRDFGAPTIGVEPPLVMTVTGTCGPTRDRNSRAGTIDTDG